MLVCLSPVRAVVLVNTMSIDLWKGILTFVSQSGLNESQWLTCRYQPVSIRLEGKYLPSCALPTC